MTSKLKIPSSSEHRNFNCLCILREISPHWTGSVRLFEIVEVHQLTELPPAQCSVSSQFIQNIYCMSINHSYSYSYKDVTYVPQRKNTWNIACSNLKVLTKNRVALCLSSWHYHIWQYCLFLETKEYEPAGYKNFLGGLPASSSCMCCNTETFKSKNRIELSQISAGYL